MTTGRCTCATVSADGHEPGHCQNALSEPKNYFCRPCAKGWHRRGTCAAYQPEPIKHLVKTCRECGFDSALHPLPPELA